jgi:ribosome-associated protein
MGILLNERFKPDLARTATGRGGAIDRFFGKRSREARHYAAMIDITDSLSLDDDELVERFVKASGPGGQHVNKTSSAVELRFDVRNSPSLPQDVKTRLEGLAGSRLTQDGVLILFSQGTRSQEMNRQEVRERLVELVRRALHVPKPRKKTRPTYSSKLKRLDGKSRRSGVKAMRGRPQDDH